MAIGERIECGFRTGRLGPKPPPQASQEAEEGIEVPKSRFKEARSCMRKRFVDRSELPQKIPRTSADLEIFGIPISDIFPHLVEGRYITIGPMKAMPDPTADSFDPWNTCDFHMGASGYSTKKCRPLMDEIKKLAIEGVLTQI
ncbi:hypothetical protein GQ457_14G014670 [Hibiscus cannabinus]